MRAICLDKDVALEGRAGARRGAVLVDGVLRGQWVARREPGEGGYLRAGVQVYVGVDDGRPVRRALGSPCGGKVGRSVNFGAGRRLFYAKTCN